MLVAASGRELRKGGHIDTTQKHTEFSDSHFLRFCGTTNWPKLAHLFMSAQNARLGRAWLRRTERCISTWGTRHGMSPRAHAWTSIFSEHSTIPLIFHSLDNWQFFTIHKCVIPFTSDKKRWFESVGFWIKKHPFSWNVFINFSWKLICAAAHKLP